MAAVATARSLFGLGHDLDDNELLALTASDNRPALKEFLAGLIAKMWHAISYDQSAGLVSLIKAAVGERNHGNMNPNITQDRFPLKGTGTLKAKGRVEAYLDGEMREQAAKRLTDAGHSLGSTGDLAGFLHDHPGEVERWNWVDAIAEDSRWALPDDTVCVPCARVDGAFHYFDLSGFRGLLDSGSGVLVLCE